MQLSATLLALAAASGAYAANTLVTVGNNGQFAFSPSSVTAAAGDSVTFEFHPKNHSVTQSTFASPCSPMANGIDTKFMPVDATATSFPQWTITIQDPTTPLWFYCAQTNPMSHCNAGMVFAINPTQNKTFNAFQAAAENAPNGATGAASSDSSVPTSAAGVNSAAPAASNVGAPSPGAPSPGAPTSAPPANGVATNGPPTSVPASGSQSAAGASSSAPSGTNSASGTSPSNNGAPRMGISASGILALTGLVAGLML